MFSSGKTSIVDRYINNIFQEKKRATISPNFAYKLIKKNNIIYRVHFWDIPGQDRSPQITSVFCRDAQGFIFCCDALVKSGAINIVVIDSVAALVPQAEIEGEMGDTHVGLQARLMSQALRKLAGTINKTNTIAIFINQLREKVGVMFGNPETTTGGRALKFYSTIRMEVRRAEQIKMGENVIGSFTKVKIVKNKVAPPFKTCNIEIMYGTGISKEGEIVDIAVEDGIIDKSGSWYSYKGNKIGQGRETVKALLKENKEISDEIEKLIREKHNV